MKAVELHGALSQLQVGCKCKRNVLIAIAVESFVVGVERTDIV